MPQSLMGNLEKHLKPSKSIPRYKDRLFHGTDEEYAQQLDNSTTIYIGEINPIVHEESLWELFSLCGPIKRIVMGVNRNDLRPCGFCFVEYYERKSLENALVFINGLRFEGKFLKCDVDHGFCEGRELGRGKKGGQLKDDYKRHKIQRTGDRYYKSKNEY